MGQPPSPPGASLQLTHCDACPPGASKTPGVVLQMKSRTGPASRKQTGLWPPEVCPVDVPDVDVPPADVPPVELSAIWLPPVDVEGPSPTSRQQPGRPASRDPTTKTETRMYAIKEGAFQGDAEP